MTAIIKAPNGNGLYLVPRTASYSIAISAMQNWYSNLSIDTTKHPACSFPSFEYFNTVKDIAVIVRNPIERFRSMVAYSSLTLEQQLQQPIYPPLTKHQFCKFFLFESELEKIKQWLDLPFLTHQNGSDLKLKPMLTKKQIDRVRHIFSDDIQLWQTLTESNTNGNRAQVEAHWIAKWAIT
jgi:hypothetical protein